MLLKRILVYSILLVAIFCSLFFIAGQNKEYRAMNNLQDKLYKQLESELIEYKENLYKIERIKLEGNQSKEKTPLEVGTIHIDKQKEDMNDIQKQIENL